MTCAAISGATLGVVCLLLGRQAALHPRDTKAWAAATAPLILARVGAWIVQRTGVLRGEPEGSIKFLCGLAVFLMSLCWAVAMGPLGVSILNVSAVSGGLSVGQCSIVGISGWLVLVFIGIAVVGIYLFLC
ncbi:hypothetical protein BD626DRAFT_515242 [Schizophyllum amplum]|uniref:Uncharacterized protein n=1 Tax=Schizophyllum amplum TaxID=97359 RepID=A0A550BXZ4_9AGAR|nr:hypothetical protein BD626DRAFT_515242 [Auriculariopsis ampla]